MREPEVTRAVAAAVSVATAQGLPAGDAVVLQNSNRVTLRLLPCDVLARVAPTAHSAALFEVGIARRLAGTGTPVGELEPRAEPRVHERDGFTVTLWRYHEPAASGEVSAADYADALRRLHAGLRTVDVPAPHVSDRVDEARALLADRDRTPELAGADRELLGRALARLPQGRAEQLLHGEPHPGNLLATAGGPLFVDLETCCRGPVEFDLAHAPDDVAGHYPGADPDVLRDCRTVSLAMNTTWRWDATDQLPDGRRLGTEWLSRLRAVLGP